jgi:hypothetical protein
MYDEHGAPTDATFQAWNAHDDHAGDGAQILAEARAEAEHTTSYAEQHTIATTSCTTCGAAIGQPCHAVVEHHGDLIAYPDATVTPHRDRFHHAGWPCADGCDDCPRRTPSTTGEGEWTTPGIDGITVRLDGADDALVVLWESGYTIAGTIRDLCEQLDRDTDAGNVLDGVAAVYVRNHNALVPARLYFQYGPETITVEVLRDRLLKSVSVAKGSYPAPVDWSTIRPAADSATIPAPSDPH